ncbi:hypothetical protein JTE90_002435 [Oedothorax gibbosus]|uniref:Uncharacterized protein n=1 Tax=Oedothorax gibbosus TaxID=931172 RepID=A0AAV6TIV1_9ARAC|nr:hypothetical protein JTE90_002435 [Oedothorax gibbosus]
MAIVRLSRATNTFHGVSHERLASDALTGRLVHPQRQFCLPKVAHWALSSCLVRPSVMQADFSPFKV